MPQMLTNCNCLFAAGREEPTYREEHAFQQWMMKELRPVHWLGTFFSDFRPLIGWREKQPSHRSQCHWYPNFLFWAKATAAFTSVDCQINGDNFSCKYSTSMVWVFMVLRYQLLWGVSLQEIIYILKIWYHLLYIYFPLLQCLSRLDQCFVQGVTGWSMLCGEHNYGP